jgi:hypothetical protein
MTPRAVRLTYFIAVTVTMIGWSWMLVEILTWAFGS